MNRRRAFALTAAAATLVALAGWGAPRVADADDTPARSPAAGLREFHYVDDDSVVSAPVIHDRPFYASYSLRNQNSFPVTVRSVTGRISPTSCTLTEAEKGDRSGLPTVVAPGEQLVGADDSTWQLTGDCQAKITWSGTVSAARTSSQLAAHADDAPQGAQVTLRASVTSEAEDTPGRVSFQVDDEPVGSAPVRDGWASLTLSGDDLDPGRHQLLAVYEPTSAGPAAATSPEVEFRVVEAAHDVRVEVSADTTRFDRPIALTARVRPSDAPGSVRFQVDGRDLGHAVDVADGSARLQVTAGSVAVGEHRLTATFSPDDDQHRADTSAAATLTVTTVPSALRITMIPAAVRPGGSLEVQGVLLVGDGQSPPEGATVDLLLDDGTSIASASPDGQGRFTLEGPISAQVDGDLHLYLSYAGSRTVAGAVNRASVQIDEGATQSPTPTPTPSATPSPTTPSPTPDARTASPDRTSSNGPAAPAPEEPSSPGTGLLTPLLIVLLVLGSGGGVLAVMGLRRGGAGS